MSWRHTASFAVGANEQIAARLPAVGEAGQNAVLVLIETDKLGPLVVMQGPSRDRIAPAGVAPPPSLSFGISLRQHRVELFEERDLEFESVFLQRRVMSEPWPRVP